ncbi:DUF4339 domain-containing protein [Verrucomicrobia bacterium]|nr:DUF4339 domain-containing protein [Verrucomicrobiota bacterium]MDC0218712.1 DUF4339 domain-containing protein [Verrucomicrobiota bacterium]
MAGAAPAAEKPAEEKPEDSEPDDPDKISVTRKGEPIGPYSREKAKEYFASGQLLPTDWGWHDGMDDWKPINEVLGMAVPAQATAAAGKSGKGKKVAMIAGIVVLISGLIFAGITYGPELVAKVSGGGKIETPKELAERVVKALKDNDKDAMFELSLYGSSKSDVKRIADDIEKTMETLAKEGGLSVDELIGEMGDLRENFVSSVEEQKEGVRNNLSSLLEEIRSSAIEDGVDWSDVTISEVKVLGLPDALEVIGFDVRVYVSITSKGKEFALTLQCMYAPSVGLFMNGFPSWEGSGGIGSWGLASNSMAQRANEILSKRNIGDLGKGVSDYADINKKLPAANNWCDVIFKEMGGGKAFISLQAPNAKKLNPNEKHCHYAINAAVAEKQSDEIRWPIDDKKIVVLFEADLGWNGVGNLEDAKKFAKDHKPRKLAVFFGDGSSELVSPEDLDSLKWTP